MKIAPTGGVQQVEALALQLHDHGGVGVLTGGHGMGKSTALALAKAKLESREDRPKVTLVDCMKDGTAATLAHALAKAMDLTIPGNKNPVAYLSTIKSKIVIRGIHLIVVDNADYLNEECREHVVRLIERTSITSSDTVGLLVAESCQDNGFALTAELFGYRPYRIKMPYLTPEEVAGFLASSFPEIAADLAANLTAPGVHAMIAKLMEETGGRPRTLADLFTSIRLELSDIKLANLHAAVAKPASPTPSVPTSRLEGPRRNGHRNGVH